MKICLVVLDDMLCEWIDGGLRQLPHKIETIFLNRLPSPDRGLREAIYAAKPDLIVYGGPAGGPYCPTYNTMSHIREVAPCIFLCFDASDVGWHAMLAEYRKNQCFDLIVNCDGCDQWPKEGNDITLWCPVGSSFYAPDTPILDRSIKFGFCGGHRAPPRLQIVSYLVGHANLLVRSRQELYGTYQGYADFLCQCRIVLNIAYSAGGPHGQDKMTKQFKARCIEVGFAKACLLETRGSAAADWLTPGVDYLQYETPEEATYLVRTASAEYIAECAENLHKKVMANHSPQVFWDRVFKRAGIA